MTKRHFTLIVKFIFFYILQKKAEEYVGRHGLTRAFLLDTKSHCIHTNVLN